MSIFFGTDGLRGVVGQDLTSEIAFKCGNGLSQLMETKGKVVIGADTRTSRDYIVNSISAGLMAGGVDVVYVGIVPTAGVAYLTKALGFDYGIVITASHNPPEYNGIKIFSKKGEKLQDSEEEKIERNFIKNKLVKPENLGSFYTNKNLVKKYINHLKSSAEVSLSGLKVVIDASNGAGFYVASKIFQRLCAKVYKINSKNCGNKINFNCGSLHPERLTKKVVGLKADMGFAFDGDADRVIAVDEKGNIIDGDMLVYGLAKVFKNLGKLKNNAIVGTSQTNMGIEKKLKLLGVDFYRADVGDKYVLETMQKHGINLGGEQSGHIILSDYMPTGDGILAALLVASECVKESKKISEFIDVELFPQVNINVVVKEKLRILGSETLANAISNVQQELLGQGRVLVRASGTEPKIRIMVESQNKKVCENLAKYLENVVLSLETEGV